MKSNETPARLVSALIIDDEKDSISLIEQYLKDEKRIRIAGSISDSSIALEQIIEIKPDLLFLDIEMPGISGLEILHMKPGLDLV
ncbi:MAG TPA: response regulator [Bacteroidales bacterium]|nr:response regulator [Bacteroidales bacterium]